MLEAESREGSSACVAVALRAVAADVRGGCPFKSVWGFIHKRAHDHCGDGGLGAMFLRIKAAAGCSHMEYLGAVLAAYGKRDDREGLARIFDSAAEEAH